jgi:hypothetical protein
MKTTTKLLIGLGALAVLSPLGLILPEIAKAGSAWGEWGADEISAVAGYVPSGLAKLSTLWSAALPDYSFPGWEGKGIGSLSLAYVASAIIGIALCAGACFLLGKLLAKKA